MDFQMGVLGSPSELHLLSQRIKKIDLWCPMSFQLWHFMQKLEMKGLYFMSFLRLPYILCQAKLKEFQPFAVSKSDQSSEILCLKTAEKHKSITKYLHYSDQVNFPVDIVKSEYVRHSGM